MRYLTYFCLLLIFLSTLPGCVHDMIIPDDMDMDGMDTTTVDPMDTIPSDTMIVDPPDTNGMVPCEEDIIYFDRDVLPILKSNCALSGCHDVASAQNGVVLVDFERLVATTDVEPFDLDKTEIYELISETDPDKRMPPLPAEALPGDQIQIIAEWILQGAQNLKCDTSADTCVTDMIGYAQDIAPVLNTHCVSCHSGSSPPAGINLSVYDGVAAVALNGRLLGAVSWQEGFSRMPQGGEQLDACIIDKIDAWIQDGAPQN